MKEKILMIIYSIIVILLVVFLFVRVKSDNNYLEEYDLKLADYSNITKAKGYLIEWDSVNNQGINGTEEGIDVTYEVVDTMENKSNTKGYKSYYLEIEAKFKTYYKVEDNSIINKTSYFIFAPDFYDSYTGVYFLDKDMNDTFKSKTINYKDKEYVIKYKVKKEEIKSEWNVIDENNKTMDVTIKYYYTFEVPKSYKGLIMGINGAYNGFVEDSNLWFRINNNETYILDAHNTNSKLYSIKSIMKGS